MFPRFRFLTALYYDDQRVAATDHQTNLANYPHQPPVVRRRFQDFAFLRDHLVKAFPASVVPPIPDKHRMGMSLPISLLISVLQPTYQPVSALVKLLTGRIHQGRPILARIR